MGGVCVCVCGWFSWMTHTAQAGKLSPSLSSSRHLLWLCMLGMAYRKGIPARDLVCACEHTPVHMRQYISAAAQIFLEGWLLMGMTHPKETLRTGAAVIHPLMFLWIYVFLSERVGERDWNLCMHCSVTFCKMRTGHVSKPALKRAGCLNTMYYLYLCIYRLLFLFCCTLAAD